MGHRTEEKARKKERIKGREREGKSASKISLLMSVENVIERERKKRERLSRVRVSE